MTDTVASASQSSVASAEFERVVYIHRPKAGVPYEALFRPEYWAHNAARFKNRDRIEIEPEDGSYYAELMVRDCGRVWAKVAELFRVDFHAPASAAQDLSISGLTVKLRGPRKWSVLRDSDKAVLVEDLATRDAAVSWAEDHVKKAQA